MPIDEFARATRHVIATQGLDGFLPTAYFPTRRYLAALQGAPPAGGPEGVAAARAWASRLAHGGEEVLLAFRSGPDRFRIDRRADGRWEEREFPVAGDP